MKETSITFHTAFQIGEVDPRIFGGFLEHMGRAVYEGVYEPDSVHADANGWRSDVLAALEGLRYPVMRYPGGNFASGYHWLDGVGPRAERPVIRELAWQSTEINQVGTDEFIQLCRQLKWQPMLTVNLGTGTPEEARNWVEYCNSPAGTKYADMRASNATVEPHAVKLWCLGNEMDGPWQLGHVPAEQYAIRAQQAAKMMKDTDSSIELVACGSSGPGMESFLAWDRQVLAYLGDLADYVSLHRYVGNAGQDTADYLAITNSIDRQIEAVDTVCRYVAARNRRRKRPYLCFDEWNVWYKARSQEHMDGKGQVAPHLIEEVYNLEDALVVAGFLNSFIRHADVVKIANIAQIVNIIAPILTRGDEMLIQSIYYPLAMMSQRRRGVSLQMAVNGPRYTGATHGEVAFIDGSGIWDGRSLHVLLTNRHQTDTAPVHIHLADGTISGLESAELLTGPDAQAANSYEEPNLIRAQAFDQVEVRNGRVAFELPPLSVFAATFLLGD
jgi:alpha-N-arabinofuranosidase